jgi:hypothetical protein
VRNETCRNKFNAGGQHQFFIPQPSFFIQNER